MAARLSRKTQVLLGVKFKAELIFPVFAQTVSQSLPGWISGVRLKSAAFVWETCLPNVGLLVKSATPYKVRGARGRVGVGVLHSRSLKWGCFSRVPANTRHFELDWQELNPENYLETTPPPLL